ncbi:MAG: IS3 family transposase [Silicimonas sp.]|nr:IS3 family transposase [Silicimonas sp.]
MKSTATYAHRQTRSAPLDKYRSINAVVESFFGVLKCERVNRVWYRTREEARADLFEYIEVFYNRKRRHGYLGNVSPADFEQRSAGSFETVY